MKKIILPLALLLFTAVSCQKANQTTPNSVQAKTNPSTIQSSQLMNQGKWATKLKSGLCDEGGHTCIIVDGGTIHPKLFEANTFDGLTAQQTGTLLSSAEYEEDMNRLPTDVVTLLQSGTVTLTFSYEDDNVINYLVGSHEPVTEANMDYAIQFNK